MLLTMAAAIAAGMILIVLSRWLKFSALVLLLAGGVVLGPEVLGIVQPAALGDGLRVIVSLAIGLILFEGGLTLELRQYRSAPKMISRLLTIGLLVTWITAAGAIWLVFGYELSFCLLAASLVIVTGPTVIAPLLKRIRTTPKIHGILHWEGVCIDPIGVFVALLCFEWLLNIHSHELVLARFALRFVAGIGLGLAGGLVVNRLIRSRLVTDEMMNSFALACAVLIFGLAESLFSEAGLLAVTVSGFVLGIKKPGELDQIRRFKAEITDLLIGTLFILLVARLDLERFYGFGLQGALVVAIVVLVARPLNIVLSAWGLDLNWREKAFLSWVAPRGIVAASMASLFTLNLQEKGFVQADFIETFTYSVIVTTVLLQSFTANGLARLLGLKRPNPNGWLVVGAHPLGRRIARFITDQAGLYTVLIDSNPQAVDAARAEGFPALLGDARRPEWEDHFAIQKVGNLLALTDNEDLNMLLCNRWAELFGADHVFCWHSSPTAEAPNAERIVWPHLPKPSVIAEELEQGEATLITHPANADLPKRLAGTLLYSTGGKLCYTPLPEGRKEDAPTAVLALKRPPDLLKGSLNPNLVMRLQPKDLDELFTEMVHRIAIALPELPGDEILDHLLKREKAYPSALGNGVALPHEYVPALTRRQCAVAQVPDGLDLAAPDGQPVKLVFLLLSPSGDLRGHLDTLAEIARLVRWEKTRKRLIDAKPETLLSIIEGIVK